MNWKKLKNKIFGRKTMETRTGNSNYSDEMVDIIINTYESAPTRETVEELAAEFDRPVRGIIAKLSQNGV